MKKYKVRIKEYRKLKGLTQKKLAEKIGISRSFLSELESGKYDISLSTLLHISDVLQVCICKLINHQCNYYTKLKK